MVDSEQTSPAGPASSDFDPKKVFKYKIGGVGKIFSSIMHHEISIPEGVKPERFLLGLLAPYSMEDELCFTEGVGTDSTEIPSQEPIAGGTSELHLVFGTLVGLNRKLSNIFDAIESQGQQGGLTKDEYEEYQHKSPREIWLDTIYEEFVAAERFPQSRIYEVEATLFSVKEMLVVLVGKLM